MKKKILALFLAMLMLISCLGALSGCSKDKNKDDGSSKTGLSSGLAGFGGGDTGSQGDGQNQDSPAFGSSQAQPAPGIANEQTAAPAAIVRTNEERMVGDWKCTVNIPGDVLTDLVTTYIDDPSISGYFNFSDFSIALKLDFDSKGVCTMSLDSQSINNAINTLLNDIKPGLNRYLEEMAREEGTTLEELLREANVSSVDELIDMGTQEVMKQADLDNLKETFRYEFRDDQLYIDGQWVDCTFQNDDLLLIYGGEGAEETLQELRQFGLGSLIPLRLERQ